MSQVNVYIKASGNCIVYDKCVRLEDILKIECTDIGLRRAIKQMEIHRFGQEHSVVFSVLKIVERIHKDYPTLVVINCGENELLVEYQKCEKAWPLWEAAKLAGVSIVVFLGSAFTIMTFHTEIGIEKVFARFYMQVMGTDKPVITELEWSYSIGLGVGIVVFFNHISKKKLTRDPTPIEVEMKKYNQDIINAKVAESDERGHTIDVS